ncbi:MAG: YbhB/YbcL family Raf kinase inhibitor-like protein, partial [Desulfosporosinus sp.]|nr:YbhB/YbcL family Raf kinase inhibitor-like protein [Desulfosporosinus sp.]
CFTTISDYDTYGYLFDSQESLLTENDDGGHSSNFLIARDLLAGQDYYIRVEMYDSLETGNYQLSVTDSPPMPDDHGNTITSATQISLGTNVTGRIDPGGDIDVFKYTPDHSGNYTFTTLSDSDTYGCLLDTNGDQITFDDDSGDSNNFLLTDYLLAGQDYYIMVEMYNSEEMGEYQLSVTETNTTPEPVSTVTLNKTELTLTVGRSEELIATIMPTNATNKSVTWTVTNESGINIVSVSRDGVVTAINPGTAVILVTSDSNPEIYTQCVVTVNLEEYKTALLSAITQVQTIHDQAIEGTDVGQYAIGSKAILQVAITQAQAVANNEQTTAAQFTEAILNLVDAAKIFEAGRVGFSATPIVELGVNPNDSNSAGLFIGLAGIKDSANNPVSNSLISGYEIEVNFDPDQVFIPYALDQSNSGELFSHNVETSNGIGKVLVSCASGSEISSFDQLFFIPIVLKGSARDLTSISVVYKDVRDDDIHRIQIPTVGNLRFQKGKIFNEDLTYPETSIAPKPGVADAIAGLQYLANRRSVGLGPNYVNPVNMASIIETQNTIANPSVKDIIALLQYTVNLRDDQFQPLNVVPGKLEFGYHRTVGTNNGIKLEIFDSELENGDLVQLLRGSDNTDLISPVTVEKTAAGVPLVLDNITFDSELYLRLKITRGNLVGERLIFESMKVSMAGFKVVDNEDVTDITVSGLQTGDQVNLYAENETQIGSPLTVAAGSSLVTFSNINIANSGLRVEIIRPNPVSRTPKLFFRWEDMINFGLKSELSSNGLMSVTVEYLESGDVVNLFDIASVPVPGRVGLPAVDGKVIINDLSLTAYYVEVIRGGFHSRKKMTKVPIGRVEFGVGIHEGTQSGKQLHLYDLQIGDEVEVFRGSDNFSLINPIIVDAAKPSPFIIDNVSFGNELFLKVRVMRNGLVGMREVFENLSIGMGTLESNNSTSIYVEGLISGDEVTLFKASGPQIGSTQIIAAGSTETVFNNVSLTNEDGIKVQIRRPNPDSLTPSMFQSWGKLINFYWHVEQTANGLETIIVGGLISGDVVNLYDINGVPIAGKQGLSSDANSQVTLRDLVPQVYQIEVVRGTVHSNWQKIKSPIPSTVVTETPAITGTIRAGDTSISGTAPAEATIRLSIDGVAALPVIADLNGNWTVSGLTLSQGNVISVSAQSAGKAISPAYVVTVSGPDVQVLDPGTVTGEFEHWKINTTGLEALTDYELSLSDNSVIEVTTDENKSIQFTEAQMETLASLGAETIEIRKPANSLTPASPFVTLLTVSSIGEAPINLERDPGNDGYNTGDEVLLGGDISGKPYEIKVGSDIWTGEINNQPHVSLTGSGYIANLTIPSAETTLLIRLQGLADKVPSMSWAVPCDLGGGGGGSGGSGGDVTPNPYLNVTSSSFEEGGVIPNVHILSGDENDYTVPGAENQSIPLNWGTTAQAGHSFFIIMTDIYANNWNHWVVKNIPNTITSLNAGASETSDQPGTGSMPSGSEELLTTWGQDARFTNGYYGPKPPSGSGTHHYVIEVFELDTPYIDTTDETIYGYTYNQLREKINGHIVRSGKLSGTYTAP